MDITFNNAAINILTKALRQVGYDVSTVGRTETNACGEMTLYPDLETSLLKQESPSLYRAGSVKKYLLFHSNDDKVILTDHHILESKQFGVNTFPESY